MAEDLDILDTGAFYLSLIPILGLAYTELSHDKFAAIMEWDVPAMLLGGATMIAEAEILSQQVLEETEKAPNF